MWGVPASGHHATRLDLRNLLDHFTAPWDAIAGRLAKRRLQQWGAVVTQVAALEEPLKSLTPAELRKNSLSLRYRAKSQEPLHRIMPEAFALVREAGRRSLKMRHFDVQILGGVALAHRSIAEMQTGEGKTLTATLPLYLESLAGKGAHLATVNDYLARRDAEWMRPIFELLGVSVGVIESQQPQPARRKAYACDVTYGTAKEFGFDFLRDRLLLRRIGEGQTDFLGGMIDGAENSGDQPVQRPPHFILVDEADSILIDEARTPLIISALPSDEQQAMVEMYKWAANACKQFVEDEHYDYDHKRRTAELTAEGRRFVRQIEQPAVMHNTGMFTIYEFIERAIKVDREFFFDRQYVVKDGEIVIVDEFTGRLADGRKWRAGLHQAVEAKQGVEVTVETGQAARITIQDYFQLYPSLAGMTGTGSNSAAELRKIYRLRVVPIPTNRPAIRARLPERVFGQSDAKWQAIVDEVCQMHATGRPVLIGTRSIDKSELLSQLLAAHAIKHQVLNARHVATEAQIVERAGHLGHVTVSTNMAGRGTDIKLGDGVCEQGGLHVILTEMHDSARIDRQLAGRCGRQGDPGSYRQYLSLDDELLMALGPDKADDLKALGEKSPGELEEYAKLFPRAQQITERRHFRDRRALMYHERERKKMQLSMGQDPYLDTPG
jgi:preprotein translocase subunit SecA